MRPSSTGSTDPNAPYRDAIASLADGNAFANIRADSFETSHPSHPQTPFAALSPRNRGGSASNPSASVASASTATPQVTISAFKNYLCAMGYLDADALRMVTVANRLSKTDLRPQTLYDTMQILHQAHHPLVAELNLTNQEIRELRHRIAGIVTNKGGFMLPMQKIFQECNNNPKQLIIGMLAHIRRVFS